LYQAVFHGSVITTHHWLFDSLKLSNVQAANELTQLLYNVPPLYHLSAATLKQRLPVIQRQDRFFRPLHQRLATQAMTD
ncbi:glycoside hydrolase, partial [Sulfitobacter sp. CW3]|nr:glycoside hydrolase [Sulfitobacter sp. CW3]